MFSQFLDSRLFEEQQEGQGGGNGQEQQQAPPALTLDSFKSLLEGFQTNILKNVDQKVNGINKEFRTQTGKLETTFKTLEQQLASFRQKEEPESEEHDEHEPEHEEVIEEPKPEPKSAKRQEDRNSQQQRSAQSGKPSQSGYKPSPKEQSLERQIREMREREAQRDAEMKRTREDADKKEIDAFLRTEISKQKFNSEGGPADFFELLRSKVVRGEDGAIYGPQGSTLSEFVTNEYEGRPFFHPAKQVNGSGASSSSSNAANGSGFDMNRIKPTMSEEDLDAGWKAIQSALNIRPRTNE